MLERGSGWPQQGFYTCEPSPLHRFGPGPVCLRCSRQKCSERVGSGSRCLAARSPEACNAKCNHLISHRNHNWYQPIQQHQCSHMQLWYIWYSLVWRAFLHWGFSRCANRLLMRRIEKLCTDFGGVSPISHFTEGPSKLFFLPTGPVQLKDFEVFKLR